ncbi:MAG: COX15/CtaA family protein [Alicyclobacillus sp.]|nr:COX15/CtaA family protein [Alicyclobacillus sp.]
MPKPLSSRPRHSFVFWLAVASVIGMFVVNTLGFVDTDTGSALGCGHDWPFCNGAVVPNQWGLHTLVEFSHRAIVGLVSVLLFVTAIWAWRRYGDWVEVRITAGVAMGGVLAEAMLGAMTVLFTNPPAVIATHLGVAISAFTETFLMAVIVGQIERQLHLHGESLHRHPDRPMVALRSVAVEKGFRRLLLGLVPYTLLAMYYGAYVASTGDGGMFQGWPFPTEAYDSAGSALWVDVLHRTIALSLLLISIALVCKTVRLRQTRPDLHRAAVVLLILVCTQAISGAILIASHLTLNAFLLHVTNVTFLFVTVAYLGMQGLPEPRRVRAADTTPDDRGGVAWRPKIARR